MQTFMCKQCGKGFDLSETEMDSYRRKGQSLPKICKECSEKNKAASGENSLDRPYRIAPAPAKSVKSKPAKKAGIKKPVIIIAIIALIAAGLLAGYKFGIEKIKPNPETTASGNQVESVSSEPENITSASESEKSKTKAEETTRNKTSAVTTLRTNISLRFRNESRLNEHYEKHGKEMGFSSAKEYEAAAAAVVRNPAALHKTEAEDGDDIYYIESTDEFVVVSTDRYIRTYFKPGGKAYFDRQ
ncbi:MAG: hypothetical protein IKS39_03540 [Clostridia bacterium]|nr:hypothetical protein [Clostridia bacterium]